MSVGTYKWWMSASKNKSKSGLAGEIGKQNPFELPEQEAFLNIARTYTVLSAQYAKLFKKHGLSESQFNVLRILRGHATPVSVYQIAKEMISPHPDMPRLIERMQAVELVTKQRCENDRRVVWVNLTKQGKSLLKQLDQPLLELHQSQLGHMTAKQLADLSSLLWMARHPKE